MVIKYSYPQRSRNTAYNSVPFRVSPSALAGMASCSVDSVGICSALITSQTSLALEPLWNKIRSSITHPLFRVHSGKTPRDVLVSVSCQLDICWDPLQREAQSEWLRAAWRVGVYDGLSWLLTDVEEPNPLWAAPLRGLCPEPCKSEPAGRKQRAAMGHSCLSTNDCGYDMTSCLSACPDFPSTTDYNLEL